MNVMNVVVSTTLHIHNSSLVSICDYFLGCLFDSTDVLYVVLTPQKAPEEVVTDGYEGALYVQCGRDDHIHYGTKGSRYIPPSLNVRIWGVRYRQ
jgi:hypothetical protein